LILHLAISVAPWNLSWYIYCRFIKGWDHPCIFLIEYSPRTIHPIPPNSSAIAQMSTVDDVSEPCCFWGSYHQHPQLTSRFDHPARNALAGCTSPQFNNCHFHFAGRDCNHSGKRSPLFPRRHLAYFNAELAVDVHNVYQEARNDHLPFLASASTGPGSRQTPVSSRRSLVTLHVSIGLFFGACICLVLARYITS
jgi:hypothetical protein